MIERQLKFWPAASEDEVIRSRPEGPVLEGAERWFLEAQIRCGSADARKKERSRCSPPQLPYDEPE